MSSYKITNKASSKRLSYVVPFAHPIMLFSSCSALNGSAWTRERLHSKIKYLADVTTTNIQINFNVKRLWMKILVLKKKLCHEHYTKREKGEQEPIGEWLLPGSGRCGFPIGTIPEIDSEGRRCCTDVWENLFIFSQLLSPVFPPSHVAHGVESLLILRQRSGGGTNSFCVMKNNLFPFLKKHISRPSLSQTMNTLCK